MSAEKCVISGTGLYRPPFKVSNEEMVSSYNTYVGKYNADNAAAIEAGEMEALQTSSNEFIVKASGIRNRYLMERTGVIDPEKLRASLSPLADEDIFGDTVMSQMAIGACEEALAQADVGADDVDLLISASSVPERIVPSPAVEVQRKLGIKGYAYDLSMACSSATFGISAAIDALSSGMATRVLVFTCEYISPAMNYRDRDSHFIFGDACVAMVIEKLETARSDACFLIKSRRLHTDFSTNIRAGFGSRLLAESDPKALENPKLRFLQNGRKVFRELIPAVVRHVQDHMAEEGWTIDEVRRMWLHQANFNMNQMAGRKLLGHEPTHDESPIILDEFANTAGAGVMIAFHLYRDDFKSGEKGIICSFGGGYSIGCLLLERV